MRKLPTDLEIFNEIYNRYYETFTNYTRELPNRQAKNYVPIDINAVAKSLGVDGDIVFGRLYYLHRLKYGYTEVDETGRTVRVPFFDLHVGEERHPIHFPMMAAILAELRKEEKMYKHPIWISIGALGISVISVAISALVPL